MEKQRRLLKFSVREALASIKKGTCPWKWTKVWCPPVNVEVWMKNVDLAKALQSRVHAEEMSNQRGACGVSMWDSESNKGIYERFGKGICMCKWSKVWNGWKRNTLRCSSHIKRKKNKKYAKNIYLGETEGPNKKSGPVGRWKER